MKVSLKNFLLISIIAIIAGCTGPQKCYKSTVEISPVIKLTDPSPVLYNTDIQFMKYHFTGLIALRQMQDSSATRVVFLSEIGLKLMEFSYYNQKSINTYCLEGIKRKSVIRALNEFIELLLEQPEIRNNCCDTSLNKSSYFCKLKRGSAEIDFTENIRKKIIIKENRKKSAEAGYLSSLNLPDEIKATMKYHTVVIMKKVDNAFK